MLHSGSVGTGARPLLYPVPFWANTQTAAPASASASASPSASASASASARAGPPHSISCLAFSRPHGDEADDNSDERNQRRHSTGSDPASADAAPSSSSSSSSSLPPSASAPVGFLVSGAASGELVHWEPVAAPTPVDAAPAPVGAVPVSVWWRPRALLFHAGAASCTAAAGVALSSSRAFVAGSSEGFLSCWTEGGARCRRAALVLPFAPQIIKPVYAFQTTPHAAAAAAAASSFRPSLPLHSPPPSSPHSHAPAPSGSLNAGNFGGDGSGGVILTTSVSRRLSLSTRPWRSYVVCANTAGDSARVFIVRLPKFQVVAILEHAHPLVALDVSHVPYARVREATAAGRGVGGVAAGPVVTTLTADGCVSIWRLSDHICAANYRNARGSPPQSPQAHTLYQSPPPLSPVPLARHPSAGASPRDAHRSPNASCAYRAHGVPCYDVPKYTYTLPMGDLHTLVPGDPLRDLLLQVGPSQLDALPPLSSPSPSLSAHLLHPTACALSARSSLLLVASTSHFSLLHTQSGRLEMAHQSLELHLSQARQAELQRAELAGEADAQALLPWSHTDALIGCAFMESDNSLSQRLVVWSAEGGVFIFLLQTASRSQPAQTDTVAAAAAAAAAGAHPTRPSILPPIPDDPSAHDNPTLSVRLFAVCHLRDLRPAGHLAPVHPPPCSSADARRAQWSIAEDPAESVLPADTLSAPTGVASPPARSAFASAPLLLVPSTVAVDGHVILCGNTAGELYQFGVPLPAPSLDSGVPAADSPAPAPPPAWLDSGSGVYHLLPAQVVSVSSAFVLAPDQATPAEAEMAGTGMRRVSSYSTLRSSSLSRHSRAASHDLLPSRAPSPPPLDAPRPPSPDSAGVSVSAPPPLLRAPSGLAAGSIVPAPAPSPLSDPANECTSSCILVDPRRQQVVFARGFRQGQLQLLNLSGPVHGVRASGFTVPAGGGPAALHAHVHSQAITCMTSVSKRAPAGDGVSVLLVTGGMDGRVCVWEMHSGHLLHTFHCGSAVLSVQQPLPVPTVPALVQAQKAGLLSPSTSDSVGAGAPDLYAATSSRAGASATDMYAAVLAASQAIDADAVLSIPPDDLLFIVCADRSVRSAVVQAATNESILAQIQSARSASQLSDAQRRSQTNHFLQVYRGHYAPVHSVLFNSFTAQHDLLVSRDVTGCLYVFSCSTGKVEQCVDDPAEANALLQTYDLVSMGSQLSLMAYQLRQLASFAPSLFQLANQPQPLLASMPVASRAAAQRPPPSGLKGAMKRLQSNIKHRVSGHRSASASAAGTGAFAGAGVSGRGLEPCGASLRFGGSAGGGGSGVLCSSVEQANQQHILCTYLLNRFLFHQQQAGSHASILSNVHRGVGAGEGVVGNNGTAAIVHRPSLLQRAPAGGSHTLKSMNLHATPADATHRLQALQLSVYALDLQQLQVELSTRYASLASTSTASGRSGVHDPKRDAQSAWHSLLSCLFDWQDNGTDGAAQRTIASVLQQQLHLIPPAAQQSFAVFSDRAQALCVLFPSHAHSQRRWTIDAECSALQLLSLSSVLHGLLFSAEAGFKPHLSRLQTYFQQQLPRQLSGYCESDVTYLSLYSLHTMSHIHTSARSLLAGVVERSSDEQRQTMWRDWAAAYNTPVYLHHADALIARNVFSHTLLKREEVSAALAAAASPAPNPLTAASTSAGSARDVSDWTRKGKAASAVNLLRSASNSIFSRAKSMSHSASSHDLHAAATVAAAQQSAAAAASSMAPHPSSPSVRRGPSLSSSSSANALSAQLPLLPEYVSDKEMMTALVLSTLFIYESNAHRAREREARLSALTAAREAAAACGDTRLPTMPVVRLPPSALLAEAQSKIPLVVHTLLRMVAWNAHATDSVAHPCEMVKLALACELLANSFAIYRSFIPVESLPLIIRRLQYISLNSNLVEKAIHNHAPYAPTAMVGHVATSAPSAAGSSSASSPSAASASSSSSPLLLSLHTQLYHASRLLLLELGRHHAGMYLFILGKEILLKYASTLLAVERAGYLSSMVGLIRKYPRAASPVLLDVVHTLLKLLHPRHPAIRASMWAPCIDLLRSLAALFPTTAFHADTGHFAVGTGAITHHPEKSSSSSSSSSSHSHHHSNTGAMASNTSSPPSLDSDTSSLSSSSSSFPSYRPHRSSHPYAVYVFDLRSGSKWRLLEGHAADVTAVCFNPSGSHVASYSARDLAAPSLRVWKLGESGFVSDLMHSHGKCVKHWTLAPIGAELAAAVANEQQQQLAYAVAQQQRRAASALRVEQGQNVALAFGRHLASVTSAAEAAQPATVAAAAASSSADPHPQPTGGTPPSDADAASASVPSPSYASWRAVSSTHIDEECDDEQSVVTAKLLSVSLRWSADGIALTREDGATSNFQIKL